MKLKIYYFVVFILLHIQKTYPTLNYRVDLKSPQGNIVTLFSDVHYYGKEVLKSQLDSCAYLIKAHRPVVIVENYNTPQQLNFLEEVLRTFKKTVPIEFLNELSKHLWTNPNENIHVIDPRSELTNYSLCISTSNFMLHNIDKLTIEEKPNFNGLISKYEFPNYTFNMCIKNLLKVIEQCLQKLTLYPTLKEEVDLLVQTKRLLPIISKTIESEFSLPSISCPIDSLESLCSETRKIQAEAFDLLKTQFSCIKSLIEYVALELILNNQDKEKIFVFMGGFHTHRLSEMLTKIGYVRIHETCSQEEYITYVTDAMKNETETNACKLPFLTPEQIIYGFAKQDSKSEAESIIKEVKDELEEIHHCAVCSKECLLRCSKCKATYYCSKEHQKEHWNHHKLLCTAT